MRRVSQFLLLLMATSPLAGAEPLRTPAPKAMTIRIYDYAGVERGLLDKAHRQTAEILARAGFTPRWEQCPVPGSDAASAEACTKTAGAHLIQLRIHPREMAKKLTSRGVEFGYSLPSPTGHGVIAGVYFDRTRDIARSTGNDLAVVLGHTIAHEIGHLLLGTNSHAKKGIMRPTWREREMHQAKTGILGFTPHQAELIRTQIDARLNNSN